jgi:O-antigen/teichoic acid export membrane protein
MFSTAVSGVFAPRVHRIVNEYKNNQSKQGEALTSIFTKVGRIQILILGLLATGMIFFGKPFIMFWAGEGYEESYYVMLLLVIPAITPLIQNIGIEIQRAQNNHRFRSIAYLLMAVFNCIFTIYLCPKYGAVGAAIGTAISFILANGITINIFYHKRCGINIISFWRSIFRMARGFVIPVAFGIILMCTLKEISFVWKIGFYIPVYCGSMWMFGMNEEEKKLIVKPIKQVFSFVKR